MRRLLGCALGLFLLVSCTEPTNPSFDPAYPEENGLVLPSAFEIYDGASGSEGANPHFFFVSPFTPTTPSYSGVADDGLAPVATVCPIAFWSINNESCGNPLVEFTAEPDQFGNSIVVDPGVKYSVPWKATQYPVQAGEVFNVSVTLGGRLLGWAEVKAYDRVRVCEDDDDDEWDDDDCYYRPPPHMDAEGFITIPTSGQRTIAFRMEEGTLEAEFCDLANVEDCDVELFTREEAGCLRVFENPGLTGELLGSQACVPPDAAELDGQPVEGTYAVILTLEEAEVNQGGTVPVNLQVPYFPDLKTDPPGIVFNPSSEGVGVVICQAGLEVPGSVPEDLHSQLRPFIVYSDGTTGFPEEYSFGAPECEGFGAHAHAKADVPESSGFLGRFAAGVAKATKFFLPRPLMARRLHGGLNTTVYNTKGNDSPGGEDQAPNPAPGIEATGGETYVVELGAVLDVDPFSSQASVPGTGQVGIDTSIQIHTLNAQGEPFPFEVPVDFSVVSGNDLIQGSAAHEGNGTYRFTYTPTTAGADAITITIDGVEMAGSPFFSTITPLEGDLTVQVAVTGGAPADGLPVILYDASGNPVTAAPEITDAAGLATFSGVEFGSHTVHLPKRDFDVSFAFMTQTVDFQQDGQIVTFDGVTASLPAGVRIWRVRDGGLGHAYQYMVGGRSWNSANNQVRDAILLGVQGHLADILSKEENDFVREFFQEDPNLCPDINNPKKCKYKGWIGLSDDAVEGIYEWTTGAPVVFFNWPGGTEPRDRKGNLDHVEIGFDGTWGLVNGASSTNEGYFAKWKVVWPQTPPFQEQAGG